jgi:hypothetical protein
MTMLQSLQIYLETNEAEKQLLLETMKDTNYLISKRIVSKAKGTNRQIALEDLKGIRSRTTVRQKRLWMTA